MYNACSHGEKENDFRTFLDLSHLTATMIVLRNLPLIPATFFRFQKNVEYSKRHTKLVMYGEVAN